MMSTAANANQPNDSISSVQSVRRQVSFNNSFDGFGHPFPASFDGYNASSVARNSTLGGAVSVGNPNSANTLNMIPDFVDTSGSTAFGMLATSTTSSVVSENLSSGSDDENRKPSASPYILQQPAQGGNCTICFCEYSGTEGVQLQGCNHHFCRVCFKHYVQAKAKDGEVMSHQMVCPHVNDANEKCGTEIVQRDVLACLGSDGERERYLRLTLNRVIDNMENFSSCPTPGCMFQFEWDKDNRRLDCPLCKVTHCLVCRTSPWHTGVTCEEYQRMNESKEESQIAKTDRAFQEFAQQHKLKECPKCKSWVERTHGCDAMHCRCNLVFCYACGGCLKDTAEENGFKECKCRRSQFLLRHQSLSRNHNLERPPTRLHFDQGGPMQSRRRRERRRPRLSRNRNNQHPPPTGCFFDDDDLFERLREQRRARPSRNHNHEHPPPSGCLSDPDGLRERSDEEERQDLDLGLDLWEHDEATDGRRRMQSYLFPQFGASWEARFSDTQYSPEGQMVPPSLNTAVSFSSFGSPHPWSGVAQSSFGVSTQSQAPGNVHSFHPSGFTGSNLTNFSRNVFSHQVDDTARVGSLSDESSIHAFSSFTPSFNDRAN